MMNRTELDPVAHNLKRAYREPEPSNLPPSMQELLRKLKEQDEDDA